MAGPDQDRGPSSNLACYSPLPSPLVDRCPPLSPTTAVRLHDACAVVVRGGVGGRPFIPEYRIGQPGGARRRQPGQKNRVDTSTAQSHARTQPKPANAVPGFMTTYRRPEVGASGPGAEASPEPSTQAPPSDWSTLLSNSRQGIVNGQRSALSQRRRRSQARVSSKKDDSGLETPPADAVEEVRFDGGSASPGFRNRPPQTSSCSLPVVCVVPELRAAQVEPQRATCVLITKSISNSAEPVVLQEPLLEDQKQDGQQSQTPPLVMISSEDLGYESYKNHAVTLECVQETSIEHAAPPPYQQYSPSDNLPPRSKSAQASHAEAAGATPSKGSMNKDLLGQTKAIPQRSSSLRVQTSDLWLAELPATASGSSAAVVLTPMGASSTAISLPSVTPRPRTSTSVVTATFTARELHSTPPPIGHVPHVRPPAPTTTRKPSHRRRPSVRRLRSDKGMAGTTSTPKRYASLRVRVFEPMARLCRQRSHLVLRRGGSQNQQ